MRFFKRLPLAFSRVRAPRNRTGAKKGAGPLAPRQSNRLTTLTVKALAGKEPGLHPDGGNLFAKVDKVTGRVSYIVRFMSPVRGRVRTAG